MIGPAIPELKYVHKIRWTVGHGVETALEGDGSGRMTDVSNYSLSPKSSVSVVENESELAPQKSEFLRDGTREASRSKVRFICIPEYQNNWCPQFKAHEWDHF